eukprot:12274824-Ditylum_brightwellii.AAC.1
MACSARAGEERHASASSFPAATATGTPADTTSFMAASSGLDVPPPSEREKTAVSPYCSL